MKRDDVLAMLRAHEGDLKRLGIQRVGIFGSVARGDDHPGSDVDLVVAFDETRTRSLSLLGLERVRAQLTDLLGTKVDLTVEPILKERFRSRVEEDLVRAF